MNTLTSKKVALLSCPFCGSNRVQVVRSFIDSDSNIVHCPHCDACGPRALSTEPEGTAEARWNASRATHETYPCACPEGSCGRLMKYPNQYCRSEKAKVVPSICGKPMPDGKGAGQCINPPGHEGDCDDMPF